MLMKIIIFLIPLISLTLTQRPYYAGTSPKGYPELASRFRDTNETSSTPGLVNRVGEGDGVSTPKIPVDARGDQELVDRLNTWPKENRPFWLINAEHIEAQRNSTRIPSSSTTNNQETLNSRAGFAGEAPNSNNRPIIVGQPSGRPSFAGETPGNRPLIEPQQQQQQRLPVIDGASTVITNKPSEAPINMITDRRSRVRINNNEFLRKQRSDNFVVDDEAPFFGFWH